MGSLLPGGAGLSRSSRWGAGDWCWPHSARGKETQRPVLIQSIGPHVHTFPQKMLHWGDFPGVSPWSSSLGTPFSFGPRRRSSATLRPPTPSRDLLEAAPPGGHPHLGEVFEAPPGCPQPAGGVSPRLSRPRGCVRASDPAALPCVLLWLTSFSCYSAGAGGLLLSPGRSSEETVW